MGGERRGGEGARGVIRYFHHQGHLGLSFSSGARLRSDPMSSSSRALVASTMAALPGRQAGTASSGNEQVVSIPPASALAIFAHPNANSNQHVLACFTSMNLQA